MAETGYKMNEDYLNFIKQVFAEKQKAAKKLHEVPHNCVHCHRFQMEPGVCDEFNESPPIEFVKLEDNNCDKFVEEIPF